MRVDGLAVDLLTSRKNEQTTNLLILDDKNAADQIEPSRANDLSLIRSSITTSESELPGTKLLCTFIKEGLNNGFKASLYPVHDVAASRPRSYGPGGGL